MSLTTSPSSRGIDNHLTSATERTGPLFFSFLSSSVTSCFVQEGPVLDYIETVTVLDEKGVRHVFDTQCVRAGVFGTSPVAVGHTACAVASTGSIVVEPESCNGNKLH